MTLTTTAMAPQAIWADMHIFSVEPYMIGKDQSGWSLICDGKLVNWFPGFDRAVNAARDGNHAETLRLARLTGGAM